MVQTDPDRLPGAPLEDRRNKKVQVAIAENFKPALKSTPKWYDLDAYSAYRDPILVIGFFIVAAVVARYWWPGAALQIGFGLMYVSYLMGK